MGKRKTTSSKKLKIAVTGHTSGIGKAIYDMGILQGYDVVGFSRATGFNLKNIGKQYTTDKDFDQHQRFEYTEDTQRFLREIKDYDVFINNAHLQWSQVDLLYAVYEMWQKQNKSIICIGSTAKDHNEPAEVTKPYYHQKIALETIVDNFGVYGKGKCKVSIVRPGWVDTGLFDKQPEYKRTIPMGIKTIPSDKIAESVYYILNQPKNVYIKNISVESWYI